MVTSCSAFNCTNRFKKEGGISFYQFPLNDPERLKQWIIAVKRKNFVPKKSNFICSAHFTSDDFLNRPNSYKRKLKDTAVPSVFEFPQHLQPKIKVPRRTSGRKSIEPQDQAEEESSTTSLFEEAGSSNLSNLLVDQSTQTIKNDSKEYSLKIVKLKRKIKTLNQKIRRKNKKIKDLNSLIKSLKENNLVDSQLEHTLLEQFDNVSKDIFMNIKRNMKRSKKGQRYSKDLKKFALTLHYCSPKAYRFCRNILRLPHPSSLRHWIGNVNAEPGFFKNVFEKLQNFPEDQKNCNLVLDGMSIRKRIFWSKAEKKFIGYCDFGEFIIPSSKDVAATEVLVFMLVGVRTSWKWPIGYFIQNKSSAETQAELILTAVQLAQSVNLVVHGVTFDGTSTNLSTMQALGCNVHGNIDDLNTKFMINGSMCYAIPDACHMLKLARNCLATYLVFTTNEGKEIKWKFLEDLFIFQSNLGLKFANKLSKSHIDWRKNKMKVKLASQIFSSSTADALEFLESEGVPQFQGASETVKFIRYLDTLFDILNSNSPFGKRFKCPLNKKNLMIVGQELKKIVEFLFTLRVGGQELYRSKRKTFVIGFAMCSISVWNIAKKLLDNNAFKYVMTYKFSQDHLELLFARIRQRYGNNNNPDVLQFKSAMKQILLKNEISPSAVANSIIMDGDPAGNIFDITWRKRRNGVLVEDNLNDLCIEEDEDSVIMSEVDCNLINPCFYNLTQNIFYYIAGFVIRKAYNKLFCSNCKLSLLRDDQEHNYAHFSSYSKFVDLKNKGGLVCVSKDVLKVVQATDHYLRLMSCNFSSLVKLDTDKIIINVKNDLAFSNIFETCSVVSNYSCHKIELIKLIAKEYLSIRLYALGKAVTEKINTTSKRHMLTKQILFLNQ